MNIWSYNFKTSMWNLFYANASSEVVKAAMEMNPCYCLVVSEEIPGNIKLMYA